eukprot:COSAG02_NODE_23385_length_720_cov_1.111111_1_plen_49_part_10
MQPNCHRSYIKAHRNLSQLCLLSLLPPRAGRTFRQLFIRAAQEPEEGGS